MKYCCQSLEEIFPFFFFFLFQKPTDIIRRKKPFSIWFPYTCVERLWIQLDESIRLGHMIDQCEKLKRCLQGALLKHLNLVFTLIRQLISFFEFGPVFAFEILNYFQLICFQLKVDSDDVQSSAMH